VAIGTNKINKHLLY